MNPNVTCEVAIPHQSSQFLQGSSAPADVYLDMSPRLLESPGQLDEVEDTLHALDPSSEHDPKWAGLGWGQLSESVPPIEGEVLQYRAGIPARAFDQLT